jgi:hypothetical protein
MLKAIVGVLVKKVSEATAIIPMPADHPIARGPISLNPPLSA